MPGGPRRDKAMRIQAAYYLLHTQCQANKGLMKTARPLSLTSQYKLVKWDREAKCACSVYKSQPGISTHMHRVHYTKKCRAAELVSLDYCTLL